MTKYLYLVLLAAVVWGVRGYDDDHDEDLIPDTNQNNREIKCGKYYAQYPNFEDCSTYIVCRDGQKTIKSCPSGQHYNDRTIRCEEPCEAYCNKTLSCKCKWSTCGLDDECFLPQIVGGCRDRLPRFYFNKRTGECERFGYSGCGGNDNNFETKDKCEQKCKKREVNNCPADEIYSDCHAGCQKTCRQKDEDVCNRMCISGCICKEEGHVRGPDGKCIPSEECKADSEAALFPCLRRFGFFPYPNNCRAFFECYNFRPALRLCPPGRHFSSSLQQCVRPCDAYCATNLACRCKWPTCGLDERCSLLPETGPCRAGFRNYYFNRTSGQCEKFIYGGCDGNPNNFQKKEDCERACPAKKEEECPSGEAWNDCKPCEKTCDNVEGERKCEKRCEPGCVCDEPGTVRGPDGTCIAPPLCPGDEKSCPSGEVWNDCKSCEKTCDNVGEEKPCTQDCKPGCVCDEPGTVRGPDGTCIAPPLCPDKPNPNPNPSFRCPSLNEGLYSNEDNCTTYFQCSNGEPSLMPCPSGLHYSYQTQRCEQPCDAHCDKSLACECKWPTCGLPERCSLLPEVGTCRAGFYHFYFNRSTGVCEKFLYGGCKGNENNFEKKDECEKICSKDEEKSCPPGAVWSKCKAGCQKTCENVDKDEPCDEKCVSGCVCEEPGHVTDSKGNCVAPPTCQSSEAKPIPGLNCHVLKDGLYPNEDNCQTFFECSNGEPSLMTCPSGLHYSYQTQRCEQPCDAHCDKSLACKCKWPTCDLPERCSLLPETGRCKSGIEAFYFNRSTGVCETFQYGGCGGNENKFETKDQCEATCSKDKPKPNPKFECPTEDGLYLNEYNCTTFFECSNGEPSLMNCPSGLHYSYQTQRCEQPCDAHCNKSLACECKWPTCGLPDRCSLIPDVGPCKINVQNYYFNRSTGECETFVYGGCKGNENRFPTKDQCKKRCSKEEGKRCPSGEVWSKCHFGRQKTCENIGKDKLYDKGCVPGCVCKELGHVRDSKGNCVPRSSCQSSEGKPMPSLDCHALEDGLYPNEDNCTTFFECSNKEPSLMNCPSGLHYSYQTQRCEQPCDAHCDKSLACECKWPTCNLPERCSLLPEIGPCKSAIEAFYFNRSTGVCEKIPYGGCRKNENNFKTKDECEKTCPKGDEKSCPSGEVWKECKGCEKTCDDVNKENPCTQDCKPGCVCDEPGTVRGPNGTCIDSSLCPKNPEPIPDFKCPASKDGLYPNEKNCTTFFECSNGKPSLLICPSGLHYSYQTQRCEQPCDAHCDKSLACECKWPTCGLPDRCSLIPEVGVCKESVQKYYFNRSTGECEKFEYGGCKGNENNFETEDDSKEICSKEKSSDICKLPPETGFCKARIPRYYFDPKSQKCETFVYGGCKGNRNNFKSLQECKNSCLKEKDQRAYPLLGCGPGNSYWGNRDDCSSYFYCRGDGYETQLLQCPSGQHFNNALQRCTAPCDAFCEPSLACECGWPTCNKKSSPLLGCVPANDTWTNVEDCSTYFYCKGDNYETELVHCPNGQHYSPSLKRCMAPCDAYCEPSIACECKWPTCKSAPSTISPCNLPAVKGPCKGSIPRWFYNPTLRSCGRFMYGGCKGNGNNFMTERDCLATCKGRFSPSEDICRLPAEKGSCKGHFEKYYFDHQEGKCTKFIYGGCEGNENKFDSPEECERSCLRKEEHSVENCRLAPDRGPCDARIEKYYFNHQEGKCEKFVYGGCEGNENKFNSQQECERSCLMHNAVPKECKTNSDCSQNKICRLNAKRVKVCIDGCPVKSCGKNAECSVKNHGVVCKCPRDFIGDPHDKIVGCKPRHKSAEPECAEDGLRSDFESCRRYIRCSSGEKETVYCPPGLHYNEANQQCDSPCDARCDMSLAMECGWPVSAEDCGDNEHYDEIGAGCQQNCSSLDGGFPCPFSFQSGCVCNSGYVRGPGGKCIRAEDCKKYGPEEFECPSPDGKFPYPDNDRKYIRCRNNISSIEECEEDQRFDSREKECV